MLKFHHSLIMLILSILENKPKFLYLFDQSCKNEEMKKNHDAIREWKFKGTRTKEVLDKLHKSLEQKDYFKEALTQTPKKRNSYFSDLDFSIRYGKAILKEKL